MIFVWSKGITLRMLEREAILQAMVQFRGNTTRVAKELGISRATIYRKINYLFSENQKAALLPKRGWQNG